MLLLSTPIITISNISIIIIAVAFIIMREYFGIYRGGGYLFLRASLSCWLLPTVPEGLYSGSDSGVQSEYSSWAAPVSGVIGRDVSTPEVIRNSASDSIDDLAERRQTNENQEQEINKYYQSDSDCEVRDARVMSVRHE